MKAVILAGGLGTRLAEETHVRPKPMVEIGGKPIPLSELGDRMGRDVFFYSISIDPEFDTPSVLAAYKEQFKIGSGWTFLTGNEAEIIELRRKLSLYQEDLADSDDHNLSLIVGNEAKGKWIKRSPYDDPGMLAHILGDRLHGGRVLIAGKKK